VMQNLDAELEHIGRESEWSQRSLALRFLAREARQTVHPTAIVRG